MTSQSAPVDPNISISYSIAAVLNVLRNSEPSEAVSAGESHSQDRLTLTSVSVGPPPYLVLHWLELRYTFSNRENL